MERKDPLKTPREILLEQHDAVNPKLNSLRELAIAQTLQAKAIRTWRLVRIIEASKEIFGIPPLGWAGLAAAWAVIIGLNLASSDASPPARDYAHTEMAHRSADELQALREQRRFFAELVGSGSGGDADRPRLVPRPRSEFSFGTVSA